jgi:hypothetical protein
VGVDASFMLHCALRGVSRAIAALYLPLVWDGHQHRFLHYTKPLRKHCELLNEVLRETHYEGGELVSGNVLGLSDGEEELLGIANNARLPPLALQGGALKLLPCHCNHVHMI